MRNWESQTAEAACILMFPVAQEPKSTCCIPRHKAGDIDGPPGYENTKEKHPGSTKATLMQCCSIFPVRLFEWKGALRDSKKPHGGPAQGAADAHSTFQRDGTLQRHWKGSSCAVPLSLWPCRGSPTSSRHQLSCGHTVPTSQINLQEHLGDVLPSQIQHTMKYRPSHY